MAAGAEDCCFGFSGSFYCRCILPLLPGHAVREGMGGILGGLQGDA